MCIALSRCAAPMPVTDRVSRLDEVVGAWDIVSFGAYHPQRLGPDGDRHAFVDIRAEGAISYTIECNYSGVTGRLDASFRLSVDASDRIQTTMGCGPQRERREAAFFAFFEHRPMVMRSRDALVLATRDTTLLLQRPEQRRAPMLATSLTELSGRWRAYVLYHDFELGNRNLIALLDGAPAMFDVTSERVSLSFDCEHVEADAQIAAPGEIAFTASQRRATGPCRIPQGDRDLGVSLLSGQGQLERIDLQRVHFVNGNVRAVLERLN